MDVADGSLSLLFENNPLPMWVYDLETLRFLEVNERAVELYGWSRDEFLAMKASDIRPPEDVPRFLEYVGRKRPDFREAGLWRHVKRDGTIVDVEVHSHAVRFRGRPAALVVVWDVTARLSAEREVERNRGRLRHLVASSPAILYALEPTGSAVRGSWVSENVRTLLGYSVEEVLADGWWTANLHPDDREEAIRRGSSILEDGHVVHEYRFRKKDGSWMWVRDEARLVRDAVGTPREVVGSWWDVGPRRSAEEALRESERRYREIVETTREGVWVVDSESRTTFANRRMAEMLGTTIEEMRGRSIFEFMDGASRRIVEAQKERRRSGMADEYELALRRADGAHLDVLVSTVPLPSRDGGYGGALAMVSDLTDRRRLETQFREAQKLESVGRLAGGIAHDFNNILTALLGYLELLQPAVPDGSAKRHAAEIRKAAERARDLTAQLLAFARRKMVSPSSLDMHEVVRGTVRMLERVLGEDIRLETDLPADLWPVRADRASIEQALLNLAVNARDAMPRGGTLSIGARNLAVDPAYAAAHAEIEPGAYVLLVVEDDGHGMDPHILERIFEPFFTTKEVGRGTGLGLASVYGTVKQAGGHVAVSSEPGRGTRFEILLPRHEAAAEVVTDGSEHARVEGGIESVLLVEDEPSVRAIAAESLRSAGYRVVEAPDGEEAVRVARESGGHFRLLVTDVVMPRRSGPETAEALRGSQPDLKVLYMSGYTDDAIARAGKTGPGDGFLAKPFAPSALLAKVREMLDR